MPPDAWKLYALMLKSRLFEEATAELWHEGAISGEMHLGTGEEGILAGVIAQLQEGDALAADHRSSAAFVMRGVDPVLVLREMLGQPDGLCGGLGGHMHLFSREHLAASSGIVGAAGPTACGFALAAQTLRPGTVAVAFFGEGSMNQGMLMESMNLAAVWNLPVLFVCKDDGWSITAQSQQMTGGELSQRARGLGLPVLEVDGIDAAAVWEAAGEALGSARGGHGPTFLHARCVHLEAHFLGFQLLRAVRAPLKELPETLGPMIGSFFQPGGANLRERLAGLRVVNSTLLATMRDPRQDPNNDPVRVMRKRLEGEGERLKELEDQVEGEIIEALTASLEEVNA